MFIADEPLSYPLSDASEWSFRFTLKQRDRISDPTAFGYGLDPDERRKGMTNASLSHNWLSRIVFHDQAWDQGECSPVSVPPPSFLYFEAVVYLPDGGIQTYNRDRMGEARTGMRLEALSGTTSVTYQPANAQGTNGVYWADNSTDGFRLIYPDGSQDIFNLTFADIACVPGSPAPNSRSEVQALLTKRIDAQGRSNRYCYESVAPGLGHARIKYIVDFDGRTNEFIYAATNSTRLTQVKNPYGRNANFA